MAILKKNFTFIDLFAGIGGFRWAMDSYSQGYATCLCASEIDSAAAAVYEDNFHDKPYGDIKNLDPKKLGLPAPDVVCGGFPCQPFSKGGDQEGLLDSRGTLFREILRIIESYPMAERPRFIILENVQNLVSHDKGKTWPVIRREIRDAGYNTADLPVIVAPKDVGVPQLRNRAIILAVRKDIYDGPIKFEMPRVKQGTLAFSTVLDSEITEEEKTRLALSDEEIEVLDCWDEFIHLIDPEDRVLGFPIWSDEFGLRYSLKNMKEEWRKSFITRNRLLYKKYKPAIQKWMKKWRIRERFTATNRKFEWQAGKDMNSVYEGIIQFRTSGVRVKRPTEAPALVAMNHRPIYGPLRRYISVKEAARLQSFPEACSFAGETENLAMKQLGNAVNVKVIETTFARFVEYIERNSIQKETIKEKIYG